MQGRFCPKCGEQIFGRPVRPPNAPPAAGTPPPVIPAPPRPRPPAAPGPVLTPPSTPPDLVIEIEDGPSGPTPSPWPPGPVATPAPPQTGTQAASGDLIGKTCPYCRFPLKPGEQVLLCPACKVPHHLDCWQENEGCTTYGCRGISPTATPAPATYSPPPQGGPVALPDLVLLQVRALEGRANSALLYAIGGLFCCPLVSLMGLFSALGVLGDCKRVGPVAGARASSKAIGAVVTASLALLAWLAIMVSMGGQQGNY